MPSPATSKLTMPKSWDEFETIVTDVIKKIWKDDLAVRNGREYQAQYGVDIYGKPFNFNGEYAGVQCKRGNLRKRIIDSEIDKAEQFRPILKELIFAVCSARDSNIQEYVRILDINRIKENKFGIRMLFWDDLCSIISEDIDLMTKHFPQFIDRTPIIDKLKEKIMNSTWEDWSFNDEEGIYTYRRDANLRIVREPFEKSHDFIDDWITILPDKTGRTSWHKVYYGNSFIENIPIVSLGGKVLIPYPDLKNLTITKYQYILGKILNGSYHFMREDFGPGVITFDKYLEILKIKVMDK